MPTKVASTRGMVVCVSPPAADVGAAILAQGGNAVDAAVATALALAVTFPEAGNIGGGGFMMVWPGDGKSEPTCIDYREKAPAVCRKDTFVSETASTGAKTVGVPGTIRGLELAHNRFGKLPWRDVAMPAVKLARDGFPLDRGSAGALSGIAGRNREAFPEFARVYAKPDGGVWKEGEILKQPDLAEVLLRMAERGPDEFYMGRTAELIVDEMRRGDGFITADDLKNYRAVDRRPVHGTFRGYDVYGPPPPSSGGTVIVTMLNIVEQFPLRDFGRYSPQTLHVTAEAQRRAYADRARYIGDPDFTEIPAHLTSKAHAKVLAATIDPKRATPSADVAPEIRLADGGNSTTHFSVVDAQGMGVSNTYTLQNSYGSLVVVRGGGFLLNNEMTDFNWKPGVTDRTGRIGTPANTVAPGKRMLSSMSPTLVARDGKLVLVTGSPGGRTIPNTVFNILLNVLEFGMGVDEAVAAPRTHHQWFPDEWKFEGVTWSEHAQAVAAMRQAGHAMPDKATRQGDGHTILIRAGTAYGAADTRRSAGKAAVPSSD